MGAPPFHLRVLLVHVPSRDAAGSFAREARSDPSVGRAGRSARVTPAVRPPAATGGSARSTLNGRSAAARCVLNLRAAEMSLRELGGVSLEDAVGYLDLLAEQKPEKLERAAVRWHGRLEAEAPILTLAESQLALAALASLCAGERDAVEVLRRLLRRVRPTLGGISTREAATKRGLRRPPWASERSDPQ